MQSGNYIPTGTITFDQKPIDNTNSFDETTGIFETPVEGTYIFFVNAWAQKGTDSDIRVHVNGDVVLHFYDGEDIGYQRQFNFFFEVILKKSDQLYLYNRNAATIYASNVHPLTFLGYLM